MFACLHGTGNLTALAFEFSPTVEATGALGPIPSPSTSRDSTASSAFRRMSPPPSRAAPAKSA